MITIFKIYKLLLFLILIQQYKCFQFTNLVVTAGSRIINTITTYQFDFDRTIGIDLNPTPYQTVLITPASTAIINFPNTYTLTDVSCIISVDQGSQFSPTCTVSGQQVIISNFITMTTGIGLISVWVSNILNPSLAITTDYFTGKIGDDVSGNGNFASNVILLPGTFSSCSSTFNPSTVNSTANMVIQIIPNNQITSNGYIVINFPITRRWSNDISTSNFMPINNIMTCSSLSSNVQSSIQCSGNSLSATVTATSLFTSNNLDNFSFSINNFLSPPTNQQSVADLLTATSYSGSGFKIDTCNFYVTNLTPTLITNMNISSSLGSSMIVNQFYTLRFLFVIPDTLSQTDTMTLVLPTGSVINYLSSTVNTNFTTSTSNMNATYSTGIRTLFISLSNSFVNISRNSIIYLNIGSYQAPPSIQPTQNFLLSIFRNNNIKMTGTAFFSAIPNTLSGLVTNVASTTVNTNTSYTFQITTLDPISSSGFIRIFVPNTVTILTSSATCATASGTNVALTPVCTFNSSENSISFSSLNSSTSLIGAQTITITVAGLRNPSTASSTGNFSARTYYRNTVSSLVAIGSITGITATAALIDNNLVTVVPSSLVVNDVGVTYSIQVKILHQISSGGYFTILIPPEIGIDTFSAPNSCTININSTSYVQTPCTAVNNSISTGVLITYTNPFSSNININTIIIARILTVFTNPVSTRPTSSFQIYTYAPAGAPIAFINSALTVQMTIPASFNSISITRASNKNYDLTTYYFGIAQNSPYQASSVMLISFPTNVLPSSSTSACSISSPSLTTTAASCNLISSTMNISLPASTISSGVILTITITNIRNPPSFQPTGTFTFQSKTASSLFTYSYQTRNPNLANTIPTAFNSLTYSFTPAIYGQPVSLQINFSPSMSTQLPTRMRLTLANTLTINNLQCISFVDFSGSCNVSANNVDIVGNFSNSVMSFSISGFISPIAAPADFTSVVTFNTNNFQLDQSTNIIKFSISCTFPCRTCNTNNTALCTSCYSQANITTMIYYDMLLSQCVNTCASGKFINTATSTCDLCNSNCLTCITSSTFCLSCNLSSSFKYLYINNATIPISQTCQIACPDRMYPDPTRSLLCVNCISPCFTCNTSTICLSCVSGTYFFNNTCSNTCPTAYYIANPLTNNCDACDSACATCSVLITNCTSCLSPLLFYQFQCRTTCPTPLVPQNGTCGPCDSTCLTCVNDLLNCTSCNTASLLPYLFNNRCQSTCPQFYYANLGIGACSLCSSVTGLNCNNCASVSICISCNTGYVLLNQTCLNYVPNGYVNISGVAEPCTGDCSTCSITVTNCTSCINNNLLNNICYIQCPIGYLGLARICQPCTSPCRSCSSTQVTCTSCLTLNPRVYLSNSQCVISCPDGTFANNPNNTCVNCVAPCQYCSSSASCLSCVNGFYLANSSCVNLCNTGYTGVNRLCQACQGNCATCQNTTTLCLSCMTNTYLFTLNNSCVTSCGSGLYVDPLNKTCIYCSAPCKTCTNTSTTCLSCLTGSLYNSMCLATCPPKYFDQSGICQNCPSSCAKCTSLTSCTSCSNSYSLYNGFCIQTCPATYAVIISQVCTLCSGSNCHECTAADVCTMCDNQYSLLNGACLSSCPASYQSNGTHCNDINKQILTTPNSFPVPFSIASAVILIACLMSKLQYNKTFLPGAVFAFLGLFECGALAYFLYLYYANLFTSQQIPFFIAVASLAYLCLLNFLAFLVQNIVFCNDKQFLIWSLNSPNKTSIFFINLVSLLVNHKFRNILFCRLFTFSVFSAQLQSIFKFKVLNIFSFLSLLHSGAAIFAASISIGSTEKQSQLFYQCIDVIVITALNFLLAFFNVMKSNDFFYEMTPQGFQLKRKSKVQEQYYPGKVDPSGKQAEDQEGFFSNVYHVQTTNKRQLTAGLMTTQPFKKSKIKFYDVSSFKDQQSFGSLNDHQNQSDKVYADISVQALQMIDDKSFENHQKLDFDEAIYMHPKQQENQNSKFTTIFNKSEKAVGVSFGQPSDKGIQNTIDHGPSMISEGVQMQYKQQKPQTHDISIQQSYHKMVDQSIQRYDTLAPVDRSIQRTVFFRQDQSMQYAQSMKSKPPSVRDASISNIKLSVKNVSISNMQPSVRDISVGNLKASVKDQSVDNMKPSVKDISVDNIKASVRDQSVQQKKSNTNKSVMYQPSVKDQQNQKTIEQIDEQIQNKPQDQSQQIQAVQDQSEKGNQKDVSVGQKSVQFSQSVRDISIQHQNMVQFDQFNQEMQPSKTGENIIVEQQETEQIPLKQNQLKQELIQEFILPKQQIKSHQEQLEQRIRDKEKELTQLKRKIEIQQKKNQEKNNKLYKIPKFYDNSNNIGFNENSNSLDNQTSNDEQKTNKNQMKPKQPLKKEFKQVQEEINAEIDKTIEQIEVIDDVGQIKKIKVQFNNEKQTSRVTQQQFLGMLEEYPNKVIFDNSSEHQQNEDQNQDAINKIMLQSNSNKPQIPEINQPIRKTAKFQQSSAEISSGKDWSTKIYSSYQPFNKKDIKRRQQQQPEINIKIGNGQILDDTDNNIQDPIISRPINPYQPHSYSDMSQTIQQMHPNLNQTTQTTYLKNDSIKHKVKQFIPSIMRSRKQIPQERGEQNIRRKFESSSNASMPKATKHQQVNNLRNQRKSSLIFAGKTQFAQERLARKQVRKASPLKTVKRWEYDHEDKNIQESEAEQQIRNKKSAYISRLSPPMETDKQVFDFKDSKVHGSQFIRIPNQNKVFPNKQVRNGLIDQISPFVGQLDINELPDKPRFGVNQFSSDFGTNQKFEEPYIEQQQQPYFEQQSQSDYLSRYKNNMILGQMLDRPTNNDLQDYYGQKKRSQKSKQKSKNTPFNDYQSQTEKIYQQKLNPNRRK